MVSVQNDLMITQAKLAELRKLNHIPDFVVEMVDTLEALLAENAELKEAYNEASAIAKKWCERGKRIERLEAVAKAAETVDLYFKALCEQWANNDGRVVSESGVVIDASKNVQELCDRAGREIGTSLAALREGEGK